MCVCVPSCRGFERNRKTQSNGQEVIEVQIIQNYLADASWHYAVEVQKMIVVSKPSLTFLLVAVCTWHQSYCASSTSKSRSSPSVKEYCSLEVFEPRCLPNELILMESAMYGRMRAGRCAVREYGPIGCGSSVMAIVDRRCSGRRSCRVELPDRDMHAVSGCPIQAASHLEAAFSCLPVVADYEARCSTGTPITLRADTGYIVNHVAFNPSTLHAVCTWRIRVAPGQRIALTLYDIGRHRTYQVASSTAAKGVKPEPSSPRSASRRVSAGTVCRKYAIVREAGSKEARPSHEKVICSGAARERIVYTSQTNAVDIRTFATVVVAESNLASDGPRFIIRYDAIGCADLQLGGNVVVRREGQLAVTVSCDNSTTSIRHHLVCKDRQWTGDLPTCPDPHSADQQEEDVDWWSSLVNDWTYAILTTVGLGVALGVVIGVSLLLATLAYCRRRSSYSEETLRSTAEKYYSTPNVVDLPSADELRFYCDDSASSKDPQTILPLTRVAPLANCTVHSAGRVPEQTVLTGDPGIKVDDGVGLGLTCVCSTPATSTSHRPGGGFTDCGRHQRTVLLVREHSLGYDT